MANRRAFEIAFVGLKPGIHEFDYQVDDAFFAEKGPVDFTEPRMHIKLSLDKKSSFMLLKFEVGGTAKLICDRCSNTLSKEIWDEFNMLVKLVDNPEEMNDSETDPDVFYISRNESHLYLSDWIYEFVVLSIPQQKMCSEEEIGGPQCNREVLEKLRQMEQQGKEESSNELWKGLEKFRIRKKSDKTKK